MPGWIRHGDAYIWSSFTHSSAISSAPSLEWRHNERNGVSNHRRRNGLLNHLFRRRSKTTSKLCVTGPCEGNSPMAGEFPSHKGPVTQKMFPFDDIIIWSLCSPPRHSTISERASRIQLSFPELRPPFIGPGTHDPRVQKSPHPSIQFSLCTSASSASLTDVQ